MDNDQEFTDAAEAGDTDEQYWPSVMIECGMVTYPDRRQYQFRSANDLLIGSTALELVKRAEHNLRHHLAPDRLLSPKEQADIKSILLRIQTVTNRLNSRVNEAVDRLTKQQEGANNAAEESD